MAANDNVVPTQNNGGVFDDKKDVSRSPEYDSGSLEAGSHDEGALVDPAVEQAIFRKLDYRIVPTVMWCYLMNMMDRGTQTFDLLNIVSVALTRRANGVQ